MVGLLVFLFSSAICRSVLEKPAAGIKFQLQGADLFLFAPRLSELSIQPTAVPTRGDSTSPVSPAHDASHPLLPPSKRRRAHNVGFTRETQAERVGKELM